MSKKIFITGGAGFIGSAIIKKLAKQHYDILVYDDLSFGKAEFISWEDAQLIKGDILDTERLIKAMLGFSPNYILHLAAIHFIPYCNLYPFKSANINITGSINVINAIKKCKEIEKILFASTAAVYPLYDKPIPESLTPGVTDIYGLSKLVGEELFSKFYHESNIPTVICRFFNAFGTNETNPHLIPEILKQVLAGNDIIKLGNILPKRDFIHTYDLADGIGLLLNKFDKGIDIFNIGQGREYSVIEVVKGFELATGRKISIEVDPEKVRKTDRLHLLADISKLSAYINWKPRISLAAGIKNLIEESTIK